MNTREIVVRVKELLRFTDTNGAVDTGRPKNTPILNAINEERRMLYSDLALTMKRRFATTTTSTYAADAESETLPAAVVANPLLKIAAVISGETTKRTLMPVFITEFHNYPENGDPQVYAILKDKIYLRPVPSTARTLHYWYDADITDLTNDTGSSPSELADRFHSLLAYGAALRCRSLNDDPIDKLRDVYQADRGIMIQYYEAMVDDHGLHEEEPLSYA